MTHYEELVAMGEPKVVELRLNGGSLKPWLVGIYDRNGRQIARVKRFSVHLDADGTHPWVDLMFQGGLTWRGWAVFFGSKTYPVESVEEYLGRLDAA